MQLCIYGRTLKSLAIEGLALLLAVQGVVGGVQASQVGLAKGVTRHPASEKLRCRMTLR
jgi:hypothetical protein